MSLELSKNKQIYDNTHSDFESSNLAMVSYLIDLFGSFVN